jgi:hypothetical protein
MTSSVIEVHQSGAIETRVVNSPARTIQQQLVVLNKRCVAPYVSLFVIMITTVTIVFIRETDDL